MAQDHTAPPPAPGHKPVLGLSRRTLFVGVTALVLTAAVLGALLTLVLRPHASLTAAVPSGDRSSATAAKVPSGFNAPAVAIPAGHLPPVEVAVPVIAVRSRLVGLRLNPDGTLQVPSDYGVAGWYSDGPAPGDSGPPAVIVGHVDSKAGPGIFYRLSELRSGDVILIRRSDGTDARFTVYRSAEFLKDAFPASQVYAPHSTPELRLITCTGLFNRTTGHYASNRVIYARLATAPAATAPQAAVGQK